MLNNCHRWVFSPEVQNPGKHTLYDWTKSPGATKLTHQAYPGAPEVQEIFEIGYAFGDSTVKGFVVKEPVRPPAREWIKFKF